MSAGGMYGKPHGWDIENVTVRAAYWLALMTSGIWLDDKQEEYVKRDSYVDNVIAYYNTGNSRYLIGTEFSYSNNSSTKTSIILQASEITSPNHLSGFGLMNSNHQVKDRRGKQIYLLYTQEDDLIIKFMRTKI